MRQGRAVNSEADLLDVSSKVSLDATTGAFTIATDVRVGRAETHSPAGYLFTKRVFVQLGMDGLQISPGRRFGEVVRASVTEEVKTSATATKKIGASGALSGAAGLTQSDVSGSLKAEAQGLIEKRTETTSTATVEHSAVKARGGNRWEIFEGGVELEGNYLQAGSPLCELERTTGSNRAAVTVEGLVNRRDLDFKADRRVQRLVLNKEKVILALLASKLGTAADKIGPVVKIASQEFSDD